jgi:hypothetical protein
MNENIDVSTSKCLKKFLVELELKAAKCERSSVEHRWPSVRCNLTNNISYLSIIYVIPGCSTVHMEIFSLNLPDYHDILGCVRKSLYQIQLCGSRWLSWLRHCATSRKVAGSIPECVIGIFHWHNSSGRSMALGLTLPLTEMSTKNISWTVKATGV